MKILLCNSVKAKVVYLDGPRIFITSKHLRMSFCCKKKKDIQWCFWRFFSFRVVPSAYT